MSAIRMNLPFLVYSRAFTFRSGALSIRMIGMETRRERYAKYREQIRHMREEDFPKGGNAGATSAEASATIGPAEISDQSSAMLPYDLYLRHRYKTLAIKIIALVLTIAAFIVWWVLMQGR